MGNLIALFNSNFFVSLVTLIGGLVAYFLYKKQKNDFKRDTAGIIVTEVRYAEKMIDGIKNGKIQEFQTILPTNNWNKYNYMFMKDLDSDELDLINSFYNQCNILDNALRELSISRQLEYKATAIQTALSEIAREVRDQSEYIEESKKFIDFISNEKYVFQPQASVTLMTTAISNLTFITTSTVGAKLKKIAKIN
jgi:hypothetical protein